MDNKKIYLAGDVECSFKKLSLDEADQVSALIGSAVNEKEAVFNNDQTKKFLSFVLEPVNGDAFDPGKMDEDTAVEVFKDFFLMRIKRGSDIAKSFGTLAKEVKPH